MFVHQCHSLTFFTFQAFSLSLSLSLSLLSYTHQFSSPPHQLSNLSSMASSKSTNVAASYFDQKMAMAKRCSHEGVVAGAKAAVVATVASAIPTLASVRVLPWARTNLNHTAQALIISTVAGAAYFIVADKTVLASARKNSFNAS
ncbi:hypothetical protein QJS10_CPA07g00601 [Acorus calamus]|uniref:Early nodulin-93-like n=1 Tax=Acorus calamus TaxID=4465 RepID=A0AAV9EK22_ACOCL|nr:hypothetical protein QJS10_CPA07g00601 [Acorus calamus]